MAAKQRVQEEALHGAALVEAIRESPYVQRLLADEELRNNLQEAIESGKSAYDRAAKKRRGGAKKLIQDQKLQNDLKAVYEAAKSAQEAIVDAPKHPEPQTKKKRRGRLLLIAIIGGVAAVALSSGLRDKLLDLLFGPEETFDYVPTANGNGATPAAAPSSTPAS